MSELLVCRQPILDRSKGTIGYELLYRAFLTDTQAIFEDGNIATSRVFVNALFEMGLDAVVGPRLAFINFTRDFLVKEDLAPLLTAIRPENFERGKVVLEVLEDIALDHELFQPLRRFKEKNFLIAMDDVASFDQIAPILDKGLVDLIKIDLLAVNRMDLPGLVHSIRKYGIRLLRKKWRRRMTFRPACTWGLIIFRGTFFINQRQ